MRALLVALVLSACEQPKLEQLGPSSDPAPIGTWWRVIRAPIDPDDPRGNHQLTEAMVVDGEDEVVVGGRGVDELDLGLPASGNGYLYLGKLAADGQPLWAERFGTGAFASIKAMVTARNGDIIIAGEYRSGLQGGGGIDLGTGTMEIAGGTDVFAAAFDRNGKIRWTITRGESGYDRAGALVADAGRIVFAAQVGGHLVLLVLSPDGEVELESAIPGIVGLNGETCPAVAVALDAGGDIYVAGHGFSGTDFGGGPTPLSHFEVGWLAAFSGSTGDYRWARTFTTSAGNPIAGTGVRLTGVAIAGEEVIVSGGFPGSVDFGGGLVDGGGQYNPTAAFLARYAITDGAYLGASTFDHPSRVALHRDLAGRLVLNAEFHDEGPSVYVLGPGGELVEGRRLEEIDPAASPSAVQLTPNGSPVFVLTHPSADSLRFATLPDLGAWDSVVVHLGRYLP